MTRISENGRLLALVSLMATHFAASIFAVRTVVGLLGLQELPIVCPIVVGLLWGQVISLGQFLALGTSWPLLRFASVAGWFATAIHLGEPFFAATGGKDSLAACCILLAMPFASSFLISAARRAGGLRITPCKDELPHEGQTLRFSLRQLFALTLMAAIALAALRVARDWVEEASQAVLFGLVPAIEMCVLLPPISLWAALGSKHTAWRSASVVLLALASVVGPLFIGRAKPQIYWMLICPAVLPSIVVIGSLLILRVVGYRSVADWHYPYRRRPQLSTQMGD